MNIAIILSGGTGSRFGADVPKQFINLAGRNIIEYTIDAFEQNENIHEICVVANEKFHEKIASLCKKNNISKLKNIISGGNERKDSSYEAIKLYSNKEDVNLIFHDAVRPFVSQDIINNTIKALEEYDAIDVAIPTADTIIQIDEENKTIENIPQRSKLQRGQTPQAFKLEVIKKAHELSNKDENEPFFTDDCGLVLQYLKDTSVYVVNGEEKNIKITYPEDLLFAEKLIQLNSVNLNTKFDFDNLKEKVIVVYGGNSGIGLEICNIAKQHKAYVYSFSLRDGVDITKIEDINSSLVKIYKEHGKIDSVINCAAVLTKSDLVNMENERIENEILTNFTSSALMAKCVYSYLKESKGQFILFTSSSYTKGRKSYSLYSSTKAAIVNFAQAIALEWEEDDIKVNVINPSRTKTPMREKSFGKEDLSSLLCAKDVAKVTLQSLFLDYSGLIIDVKQGI